MKRPPEFPTACADCGGPLLEISTDRIFDRPPGPRLPVWVHARHRDWSASPHAAVPVRPAPLLEVLAEVVPARPPRRRLSVVRPRARRSA